MSTGGGGTTTVTQQPPQLLPEGKEGYEKGQQYYKGILENPPIYEGPRVAPVTPTQEAYMEQGREYMGARQPYQGSAERQAFQTTEGDYLYDPNQGTRNYADVYGPGANLSDISLIKEGLSDGVGRGVAATGAAANYRPGAGWEKPSDVEIQRYVESASQPILRGLEEETLPSIQSDFGIAGGGVNNVREQLSKQDAINRYASTISTDVIAPVFNEMQQLDQQFKNAERERQLALASGDADRATQASIETARIQSRMSELDAQMRIAGSELSSRGIQEGARDYLTATEGEQTRRLGAWTDERGRQLAAAGMAPELLKAEGLRETMLRSIGDYERAFNQEAIAAQREAWAEPIQAQSSAANALFGASGAGPGGASSVVDQGGDEFGQIMQGISTAAMVASMIYKV